jgi:hypothetical protein
LIHVILQAVDGTKIVAVEDIGDIGKKMQNLYPFLSFNLSIILKIRTHTGAYG